MLPMQWKKTIDSKVAVMRSLKKEKENKLF